MFSTEALVNSPHHYCTASGTFTVHRVIKFCSASHFLDAFWLVSDDASSSPALHCLQGLPIMRGCDPGRLKSYFWGLQQGTPMPFNFGCMTFPPGAPVCLICTNYLQSQVLWKSRITQSWGKEIQQYAKFSLCLVPIELSFLWLSPSFSSLLEIVSCLYEPG